MKWVVYVLVVLYMFYRAVYGAKPKEITKLEIEPVNYGSTSYLQAGLAKKIVCKGSTKTQKVEWYDPEGHLVKRQPKSRVHVQDNFVPSFRSALRSQVLFINHATVEDSGVWECRSGDLVKNFSLCVIDPVVFMDTKTEVTVDVGRSITLACHARGEPEPTIGWIRNGEFINITNEETSTKYKIMKSYKSQGIEGLLTVMSLEPYDGGVYKCVAMQENLLTEDCSYVDSINITLNVNFGPVFRGDNGSVYNYYAKSNESIELVCDARANPTPTYRWFHENGEVLTEFSENQIKLSDDGYQAMLPMVAGPSTFDESYICKASNSYGDAYMQFKIKKLEKPGKPIELSVANYTDSEVEFLILWDEEKPIYPVDSVDIQYMKKKSAGIPREFHWRHAKTIQIVEDNVRKISGLDEQTEYWVRLRWKNRVGDSGWSTPMLVRTDVKPEPTEEQETEELVISEKESKATSSNGIHLYGIIFAGAIMVISAGCTFIIRKL